MESSEQKPPWKHVDFCPGTSIVERSPSLLIFTQWLPGDPDKDLHREKDAISIYEKFHIWEIAKKMANPYESIYTQDDNHFHPSVCIYRPLSRSFYKMVEIMSVLQLFPRMPKQLQKIRSAHVAEGPGGFIEAFLEISEKNKKTVSAAYAMTLKPKDNHTPGWRRASSFLQRHPEVLLEYGTDGTGDIYSRANQQAFIQRTQAGVHLFTADGGFDFSTDYCLQERHVYHLLICSAKIGLQVLLQDGCLVIKMFDIYSEHTKILITLIGSCFKEWSLYKPATSRPCNSERYLLCRGYKGKQPEVLAMLAKMEENSLLGYYPTSENYITPKEREYLQTNTTQIVDMQKKALSEAKYYIENPAVWKNDFQSHFSMSAQWCSTFQMPYLQRRPSEAAVQVVVSQMSERVSALQSQRPGAVTAHPRPSDPEVLASS
jgi:23S rRNA U2552 (ribose-2'-O)-methylase RlmE/FtsJ